MISLLSLSASTFSSKSVSLLLVTSFSSSFSKSVFSPPPSPSSPTRRTSLSLSLSVLLSFFFFSSPAHAPPQEVIVLLLEVIAGNRCNVALSFHSVPMDVMAAVYDSLRRATAASIVSLDSILGGGKNNDSSSEFSSFSLSECLVVWWELAPFVGIPTPLSLSLSLPLPLSLPRVEEFELSWRDG